MNTGTTNLPALLSMYEQAQQDYDDWKLSNGMKIKTKNVVQKIHHQGGATAGWKAGNDIGLDTQVSTYAPVIQIGAK